MKILGIDAGNYKVKVCTSQKVYSFLSDIGEYRERKLIDTFGDDDISWEYKGQKGFAGSLARYESEFGGTMKGTSKANDDAILRVLISVYKYGDVENKIIVGQPIDSHDEKEKAKIKSQLSGQHEMIINGKAKDFSINEIEVAPEGSSAILSAPKLNLIRVIDIGSGTTNFATLYNLKRIDKDSFTERFGTETTKSKDPASMAKKIFRVASSNWNTDDEIYLTGGGANNILKHLKEYFSSCKIIKPNHNDKKYDTEFANCIGFYRIAEKVYEND